MTSLHMPECDFRKFDDDEKIIICKKNNSIKTIEECLDCKEEERMKA